jgi:hypothetical protein
MQVQWCLRCARAQLWWRLVMLSRRRDAHPTAGSAGTSALTSSRQMRYSDTETHMAVYTHLS